MPKEHTIVLNYDEIPASFAGLLSNVHTLEHGGSANVMVAFNDNHFKRMGTLIASLAVRKVGDVYEPIGIKPAIILKQNTPKAVANPHNLLVSTTPTGVINSDYMKDHFIPNLQAQLQALGGKALVIMDSASAHISAPVLKAFHKGGCHCAVIPGGLTMFVQSIDVALASRYRVRESACMGLATEHSSSSDEHHREYCAFIEGHNKLTAAQTRDAFVALTYKGYTAATQQLNVPGLFQGLGYLDPTCAKLRVPFQFVPPVAEQHAGPFYSLSPPSGKDPACVLAHPVRLWSPSQSQRPKLFPGSWPSQRF